MFEMLPGGRAALIEHNLGLGGLKVALLSGVVRNQQCFVLRMRFSHVKLNALAKQFPCFEMDCFLIREV